MNKDKNSKKYSVLVSISNKKYLPDPEGETILKDLILKGGFSEVEAVRCSKTINMLVRSRTEGQAKKMVLKICAELRLYNPVVSKCDVTVTHFHKKLSPSICTTTIRNAL